MARSKLHLSGYLPYLVNRLGSAMVERFSEQALARHDLSIAMWRVLVVLADMGPQRQIDLSALTSVDVSTLSRLVTRLTRRGLVTRARSAESNREVTVALTAKAKALIGELVPVARKLEETATAGLQPGAVSAAKAALRRMYKNLDDSNAKKTPHTRGRARRV